MEKQRVETQKQAELQKPAAAPATPATPGATPGSTTPQAGTAPSAAPGAPASTIVVPRDTAIASTQRIKIDSPKIAGSISLKGARLDDVALTQFRETVDPKSPAIVLFSPSQTASPYYAEFGWVPAAGSQLRLPDQNTVWTQEGSNALTPSSPVVLKYDNAEGLTFKRTIAIDERYLFTVKDEVNNVGSTPVTLYPFALISRHGTPEVSGYYILHEGLIGYLGEQGLQEYPYKKIDDAKQVEFNVTNAWLGITDKYWASALLPDTTAKLKARFSSNLVGKTRTYQTDYLGEVADDCDRRHRLDQRAAVCRRQGSGRGRHQLPAGRPGRLQQAARAQPFRSLDRLGLVLLHHQADVPGAGLVLPPGRQFRHRDPFGDRAGEADLLPARQQILRLDGEDEVGAAAAAGAEGALPRRQGEAAAGDDGDLQEGEDQPDRGLSSRRLADPGVLLALQGAVRHHRDAARAILRLDQGPLGARSDHDLQSVRADPVRPVATFGPHVGAYLMLGVWPIIMGITMWIQMKLNPAPPDPTQKMIFDWMPLIFTFMLASFPAGLVIYWAWNNLLSVIQQSYIMRKNGVKVELFDNLKSTFAKKPQPAAEAKAESKT